MMKQFNDEPMRVILARAGLRLTEKGVKVARGEGRAKLKAIIIKDLEGLDCAQLSLLQIIANGLAHERSCRANPRVQRRAA